MSNPIDKVVSFFNSLSEDKKVAAKELFAAVKDEKFEDAAPAGQAPSYTEVPLEDGTILKVSALEVGGEVILVSPEGEVPAPEGEHKLADGSVLVVKKEGEKAVIAEIKPAAEMKKDTPSTEATFAAIEEKFAALKAEALENNKALKAELEAVKLKLSKANSLIKQTVEVVEAFSSVPTAQPIAKPTQTVNKKDEMFNTLFKK
jgi:hypothetical protein